VLHLERLDDGVAVLHMRRGENRMNREWLDAMNALLDEALDDERTQALVTTGENKFFSNGLDLDWLMRPDTEDIREFAAEVEGLFARLLAFPLFTVAACNGHTFAAGAMLALCHDFRVMRADRGFFCLPEVDLGIPFTPGMDSLVTTRMPRTAAHDVMVTGRRVGGDEAAALGIVHQAVAEGEVVAAAVELARRFGGKDRTTLGAIKRRMDAATIALFEASDGLSAPR
jgi:enoyl-CoA hydratase/carnithine racemase